MMSSPSTLSKDKQLKKLVEQLERESKINRITISEAAEGLKNFCEENIREDPLIIGVSASGNPYKDKGKCAVL